MNRCDRSCFWFGGLAFLAMLILVGCIKPPPKPTYVDEVPVAPALPVLQYHVGGRSVQRHPIIYEEYGFGADVTFILATIHGNEGAGTPLVKHLGNYLKGHQALLQGRKVIILPMANPDGHTARSRHNIRGIDLNRNFPAGNRIDSATYGSQGLSEPESVIIADIIRRYRPDRIVALHQPLTCVDYDGPAQDLAQRMADACHLPLKKLGARPGSLGAYAGETLGIPIVTFEMERSDSQLNAGQLWQRYGKALLAAITY
jgi:murein peptide amidase A